MRIELKRVEALATLCWSSAAMASTTLPSGNPHSSAPQGGFEHSKQQVRETWKKTRKERGWNEEHFGVLVRFIGG